MEDTRSLRHLIMGAYTRSPLFKSVFPLFEDILSFPSRNLSAFLFNSLQVICDYLGINTPLLLNSDRKDDTMLRGEERVIHLCHAMGADTYINAIGGQKLYSREHFAAEGINLKFLQSELPPYRQLHTQQFVPGLSILDIMMNVPVEEIRKMLDRYTLI